MATYAIGDLINGGDAIVISVDTGSGVTMVRFPNVRDGAGNPLTVSYNPVGTTMPIEAWVQAVVDLLG